MFRPLPFALLFSIPLVSPADDVEITGNVTPSPASSPTWTIPGQLVIGLTGNGTLAISGSGSVTNTSGIIANGASSVSSVSVSGGSWTNSSFLAIGVGGSGTLEISGTGDVSSTTTSLASNSGSTGSLQLLGGTLTTGQVFEGSGNGIVTFNGGTLRLSGNQSALFNGFENGDVTFAGAGTIDTQSFQVATGLDLGGLGSPTKAGSGALTLTGTNNYSGGTTIAAGTLQLGNGGSTGSITGNVNNNGTLVFNRSDDLTFGGVISGTGYVTQQGSGTLTLSNATSNYTGVTTVSGGTLSVVELEDGGVNSAIGAASGAAANLVLDGGTLRFTGTSNWTSDRLFTLGAGGGTLEASGATGTAGLASSGGGVIAFTGTGARTLTLTGSGNGILFRRALADSGSGATGLTKDGSGTWTWSGIDTNLVTSLTYTGATNVNSGTLIFNYATTSSSRTLDSAVTVANGAEFRLNQGIMYLGSLAGAGTVRVGKSGEDLAQLVVGQNNSDTTFSGTIAPLSGFIGTNIGFAKIGTGTMTIVGNQNRTGYTLIQGGVLSIDSIADGGVASSIGASSNAAGNLFFSNGGTLRYTGAEASTNRRFSFIDSGSSARSIESSGTGPLHFTNTDTIGNLSGSVVTFALSGSAGGTFAPILPSDLRLRKEGTGTWTITGNNTYTEGTTISEGILQIGNGGTSGSITGNVTNNSTLVFNRSDDQTFSGVISGTGNVTHKGGGTLTLSNASNSYTGVTTVSGGTLSVVELEDGGVNSAIGAASGAAANLVLDGGTLRFTREFTWFSNRLFTLGAGGGTLEAAGAGMASFVDSSFGGIGFTGTGARTLTLTGAGNGQFQRRALTDSGSGATSMTKDGTGTWTWSGLGANHLSYTGATNVNSGTLVFNYSDTSSSRTLNSAVTIADGAEFRINHGFMYLGSLAGAGTIRVGKSGEDLAQLIVGQNNSDTTFSGTIEPLSGFIGTEIALAKIGTGTMTITGNQSRTGYTFIQDGVLSIDSIANGGVASGIGASPSATRFLLMGNGGTLRYTGAEASTDRLFQFDNPGSAARTIESSGTGPLHFTNPGVIGNLSVSVVTFALSGSAGGTFAPILPSDLRLRKEGTGTWTITGNNTYTEGTTISEGILQIGNGGTSGSITGNVTNNSTLLFNRSDDLTFSGEISGTGNVTKQGAGTLTLTGTHTYTGQTRVQEGTLSILGNTGVSEIMVNPGATLAGTGTVQNISLLDGGLLAPGNSIGTLNAASLLWNAGARLRFELGGGLSDLLVLSGGLTMAGSGDFLFTFEDLGWEAGQTYTLIEFGNTNFTVDDFGFTNTGGFDGSFLLDETSLKFTVATIPEPGTTAPLLLGLMLLAARRRRAS